MNFNRASLGSAFVLAFTLIPNAQASYTLNVNQTGSSVIATGSGSINTAALTISGTALDGSNVWPSDGVISVGPNSFVELLTGISGPTSFGSGPQIFANLGTGTVTTLIANLGGQGLYVPNGYVSGSALSATATWNNQTLAGLGLTAGTYTYTWGSGGTADSFVLNIVAPTTTTPTATPAPSSVYLVTAGLLGLAIFQLWRRKTA
jgi:hypothetical protein